MSDSIQAKRKRPQTGTEEMLGASNGKTLERRKSTRKTRYEGNYRLDDLDRLDAAASLSSMATSNRPLGTVYAAGLDGPKSNPTAAAPGRKGTDKVKVAALVTRGTASPLNDSDGHLVIKDGLELSLRYSILSLLGQGTFGKVVKGWDQVLKKECAIKIIKAIPKYTDAAAVEIKVLRKIRQLDPKNEKCVRSN
ncbi:dual specificity protein kinase kns1 [Kappamyces sp. JEL0680]|nr:dual specificity protein kinase kns1 [Kappamyces sp. JEL0680]